MLPVNRMSILTPTGGAAIAVVRLVGRNVKLFLDRHFSQVPKVNRCVYGELRNGERVLDDVVVTLAGDETCADISLHGGPWIVRSVLDLAREAGFVISSDIDWIKDTPNQIEREVLEHLPLARTELALRALLTQIRAWATPPAQDAGAGILADRSLWWLLHPPRVAIIGAPNVGKSTLANQLFGQERSITADLPGTTRDWVGEMADLDGLVVTLVDTPGIRTTEDPIEREAIQRSATQVAGADLVVAVLDVTRGLDEQRALVEGYPQALRVANKCDRPMLWRPETVGGVEVVATTGAGVGEVIRAIRGRFGVENYQINQPRWWTERQRGILERAVSDPGAMGEIQLDMPMSSCASEDRISA